MSVLAMGEEATEAPRPNVRSSAFAWIQALLVRRSSNRVLALMRRLLEKP